MLHGKDYYFAAMHPLLIAAGAVALVRWSERHGWRWPLPAIAAFLLVGGTALLPLGVPILPRDELARYTARLGITRAVTTNRGSVLPLPQDFADMIGWEELATTTARVYHALPEADQRRAAVAGGNYGRAGALALYAARLGMTYPISRHGDFFNWGLPARPVDILIITGGSVDGIPAGLRGGLGGGADGESLGRRRGAGCPDHPLSRAPASAARTVETAGSRLGIAAYRRRGVFSQTMTATAPA